MPIERITPLMQQAFDTGAPLIYFAELWLSVMNESVDTQTEFQASSGQTHTDFTTRPGYALIAVNAGPYYTTASFTTAVLDLGRVPTYNGVFQKSYSTPANTGIVTDVKGSSTGVFGGEEVTFSNIPDGFLLPPYRYWQIDVSMTSDGTLTPMIDMLEVLFPRDRMLLSESTRPLRYCEDSLKKSVYPLLKPLDFKTSELRIMERISSGGEASATLTDPTGEVVRRIVSDFPLRNHRAMLYIGADMPGFSENDLYRFFTGMVKTGKIKPKYRRNAVELPLSFINPILELNRKAPAPDTTGVVSMPTISIDGMHVLDAMLYIMRESANIPARYINLESFDKSRVSIGDGTPASDQYIVRRAPAGGGLPGTEIKEPDEIKSFLAPLCVIADGYIVDDEDSRITFVKHDTAATPEAVWADEDLVKAGADAVPIEDMQDIDLGLDERLFNAVMMGANWDGTNDDWTGIAYSYCDVNADSVTDFASGKTVYLSLMEKNMLAAAKWLGPETTYHGETLTQELSGRLSSRFAYPPAILHGVIVPTSQFMRGKGSAVKIWSREVARFKRLGIAESETVKFLITNKKLDRDKNRMTFDLVELK